MRKLVLSSLGLLAIAALAVLAFRGTMSRSEVPQSALIVKYGDGRAQTKVYRLADAKDIATLEAFFPGYQERRQSNFAAGWAAGYEVYFNFSAGRSIHLTVSHPGAGNPYWSLGDGDFNINGDFHKYVTDMD
jgi:hypothetical protein